MPNDKAIGANTGRSIAVVARLEVISVRKFTMATEGKTTPIYLEEEMKNRVTQAWKEAVSHGTLTDPPFLDVKLLFEDVFAEMPEHLKLQQDKLLRLRGGRS